MIFQTVQETENKKRKLGGFARKKLSERLFLAAIFIFPVLQFFVFYICVNINSILLAFKSFNQEEFRYYYTGLVNFKRVFNFFKDARLVNATKNGMIMYCFTTFVGMPINLFVAYLLYKKIKGAEFFRTVLFIPSLISSIAMIIMFKAFLNKGVTSILINSFHMSVYEVPRFLSDPDWVFPVMIFYSLWVGVGGGMIIYMSSMSRIPVSIIEYGRLEGITLFREFRSVIFPMIYPMISLFFVTGLTGLFMSSGPLYSFFGDQVSRQMPEIETLGYYLFTQVIGENASFQEYPFASAIGLTITLLTAPLVFIMRKILDRFDPNVEY